MMLQDKIRDSSSFILRTICLYKSPMVMSSFGKDSMVMLDILKRLGLRFPIVFHREPFFPKKYEFAERVIRDNDYVVYDYPPMSTGVVKNNGQIEIVNFYQVKTGYSYVPTGIRPPVEGKPFLCGLEDIYLKPIGTFNFRWDLGFLGHKSTDIDPILGPVPLLVDLKVNPGSCSYAFPLRHFTDEDIWEYHKLFDIPINEKRYDPSNGFRERQDIDYNPDYYYSCTLCIDKDSPSSVFCPKYKCEIPNVSSQVRYTEPGLSHYVGEKSFSQEK